MNITFDVLTENYDDKSIQLVYEAMLDTNISSECMDGLTLEEVREILTGKSIHRVLVDGEVVGVFNPGTVHISCYFEWRLERGTTYNRIGFIYIDKNHRNKGYASKILKDHIDQFEHYAECCHEDNVESNALLSKLLPFHRRAYISYRQAYYNIYVK